MIPDHGAHADIGVILYAATATKRSLRSDVHEFTDMHIVVDLGAHIDDAVFRDVGARADDGTRQYDDARSQLGGLGNEG